MINYSGPLYARHPDLVRDYPLCRLAVWNNTANAHTLSPIGRSNYNYIQNKITKYMHEVMHRPNQIEDDQW